MSRKFEPFDERIIRKEFWELNTQDFLDLTEAMKNYQLETGVGYTIDNYGEVLMIKGSRQGRGLFFTMVEGRVVLLLVYKKESQKAPKRVIDIAVSRKKEFLSK